MIAIAPLRKKELYEYFRAYHPNIFFLKIISLQNKFAVKKCSSSQQC